MFPDYDRPWEVRQPEDGLLPGILSLGETCNDGIQICCGSVRNNGSLPPVLETPALSAPRIQAPDSPRLPELSCAPCVPGRGFDGCPDNGTAIEEALKPAPQKPFSIKWGSMELVPGKDYRVYGVVFQIWNPAKLSKKQMDVVVRFAKDIEAVSQNQIDPWLDL